MCGRFTLKNKNKIKETQLDEFENYFRSTIKICKVFNIQTIKEKI